METIYATDAVLPIGPVGPAPDADWATADFGPFVLDRERRQLSRGGEPVRLGSRAFDILVALAGRAGQVISRHELVRLVWQDVAVEEAGARVHIASLRKALADGLDGARYIVNVSGRGYCFVSPIRFDKAAQTRSPEPMKRMPAPPRPLIEDAGEAERPGWYTRLVSHSTVGWEDGRMVLNACVTAYKGEEEVFHRTWREAFDY
jgi:DNA-binding winged helix-turn-helix (wHTH) protein